MDYVDACVIFLTNSILRLVDSPEEGNSFFSFELYCVEYFCGDRESFVSAADIIRKILSSAVGNCGDWQCNRR